MKLCEVRFSFLFPAFKLMEAPSCRANKTGFAFSGIPLKGPNAYQRECLSHYTMLKQDLTGQK